MSYENVSIIRAVLSDKSEPTAIVGDRVSWPEGKTGFGQTGFGKLRRANVSIWSHATAKPFGKVKPGAIGGTCQRMPACNGDAYGGVSQSETVPVIAIVSGKDITKPAESSFDEGEMEMRRLRAILHVRSQFADLHARTVISRAEPSTEPPTSIVPRKGTAATGSIKIRGRKGAFKLKNPLPECGRLSEAELSKMRDRCIPREP